MILVIHCEFRFRIPPLSFFHYQSPLLRGLQITFALSRRLPWAELPCSTADWHWLRGQSVSLMILHVKAILPWLTGKSLRAPEGEGPGSLSANLKGTGRRRIWERSGAERGVQHSHVWDNRPPLITGPQGYHEVNCKAGGRMGFRGGSGGRDDSFTALLAIILWH